MTNNTEYTPIRRLYAWVGFAAIIWCSWSLVSMALYPSFEKSIEPEQNVAHNPILDVIEDPIPVILATTTEVKQQIPESIDHVDKKQIRETILDARITGYNTVESQTDSTPCIAANGENICGRYDTVACPSWIELGTKVFFYGRIYECVDRTHPRFDDRFDINCNLDMACPSMVTGYAHVHILD